MELYLQRSSLFLSVIFSSKFDFALASILILPYIKLMSPSNVALVFLPIKLLKIFEKVF